MNDSDELLLDRWCQQDASAFERLFVRHYSHIYRVLHGVVGNREEAEDLVQETFLTLYNRPPRRAEPGGVAAWLRRVALNRGYNALRGAKRAQLRLERIPEPTPPADPQVELLRSEEAARVKQVLLMLPERQRDLLLLRQSGASYEEIAQTLQLAPGSVGTLLSRAQKAFLKLYETERMHETQEPKPKRTLDARSVL